MQFSWLISLPFTLFVLAKYAVACNPTNTTGPCGPTSEILEKLRQEMTKAKIQALIVTSDDEHQNEFVGPSDKRIKFISGFTGSAGTAVVTHNKAALWTDGRYHIQAENELDSNWVLMRSGLPNVPSIEEWLHAESNLTQIGADPILIPATIWHSFEEKLCKKNVTCELVKTSKNLVDSVWLDKPHEPKKQAFVLDVVYSGKTWQDKINETRHALKELGADAIIVTALDEIAWLLNLRGYDIPHTPVVQSYLFLSQKSIVLFIEDGKVPLNFSKVYEPQGSERIRLEPYTSIWDALPKFTQNSTKILVPTRISFNAGASKKIHDMIPNAKRLLKPSPIVDLKAIKNEVEIKWMEYAQLQDAVALCEFFEYFEEHLNDMDEFKVSQLVDEFRSKQKSFVAVGFETIAAYGPHGAAPHYIPTPKTSIKLQNGSLLVLDSGGQYLGGTTDITRTVSIGPASQEQKEAYTRVLMGVIEMSTLIFPDTLTTSGIDVIARAPLWEIGTDYLHGTGHGIGSFLLIHESPINFRYNSKEGVLVESGYLTSIEPGIYLEGKFGVRIENDARVIHKNDMKYNTTGVSFLGFKTVTLFPYDIKLIDFNLLSTKQIKWLKEYYKQILNEVGGELKLQNKLSTYTWLRKQLDCILDRV